MARSLGLLTVNLENIKAKHPCTCRYNNKMACRAQV